ncbi:PREDICTED: putative transcription factor bHLH041 [Nicotiana attenuata]|uniref:Transcription factor bhlh041 n=1 Tax=Nicotiana attenuata TaxID=49451 RepID=A0A1J6KC12_NICAT|nr:PREDICTED: putative transcription factor bHLH041 [Nicotiana attenuata]OIT19503.1 putative transcription factor bhlh041 [Nicotiana attenuata]
MDSIFFLEGGDRAVFLLRIMESLGCTYICLWQYYQPSNCFMSLGGIYNGDSDVAQRLFQEYRHSWLIMDSGRIPGLAFKNNVPYMELQFADFQSHASNPVQLQFYQEAGIKTVICMGCSIGEIEVGMTSSPQVNLEMGMTNLFAEYFSRQAAAPAPAPKRGIPNQLLPIDQNRPSSSSSFSIDSPGEYSSLLFNVASTSPYVPEPPRTDTFSDQSIRPIPPVSATPTPYHQVIQTLNQTQGIQFPTVETEDAELTRAYLAVMTSPSSSSSSRQSRENLPTDYNQLATQKATAFRRFRSGLGLNLPITAATTRRQNMVRRSINFFRNLNMMRSRQEQMQPNPRAPTSTQVHHMISERRRREKLNDSFQLLRSLLPPGTKKDKASVLASTTEYLSSLKTQVEELSKKNEMLEAQLLDQPQNKSSFEPINQAAVDAIISTFTGGSARVAVEMINVGESTSESRIVDLQISVRRECSILDLVTRLLELLKSDNDVNLESVAANTRSVVQSEPVTHITLRLRIEGSDWDESSFQEAVKRIVDDLA